MKNNKQNYIYFTSISFFFGIVAYYISHLNLFWISFLFFLTLSIWLFLKINLKKLQKFSLLLLIILFFVLGFMRADFYNQNQKQLFDNKLNQKIEKIFIIDDEPEKKSWHTKLILRFENTDNKAIAWVDNLPKYQYGDKLKISGWLLKIKNFESEKGNFDYENFLKKDNIFYEIKKPEIEFISSGNGNVVEEKLFQFKNNLVKQIKKILPEPESSLLAGILIGAKEDLGEKLLEKFRKTGIIHIVVLSGYNLTILAQFIMIILSIFGRKISAFFSSLSIILFAIMTGASATIVRASLMALLVILAKFLGRSSEAIKLLFLAAMIMLVFNPMLLLYDPSFQLSFLATLGLLLLSPKIEEKIKYADFKIFSFKEIFAATIATQIFVFPLLLYMMGEISIIAPIVNILILVLVPFSMFYGIFNLVISYINIGLGILMAYINHLILAYDLWIVDYFSKLDFSVFEYNDFSLKNMLFIYFLYFLIFLYFKIKKKKTII